MKNKKMLLPLCGLAAVMLLFAGVYGLARPAAQPGEKSYTVEVTHKDGSTNEFSCRSDEAYLGPALIESGLIQGRQDQIGYYILEVDGEAAIFEEDGSYWAFYQNGAYATLGVDQTPIVEGSRYAFVYTHG